METANAAYPKPAPSGRSRFGGSLWGAVWIPALLVAGTVVPGWIGFYRYYAAIGNPLPVWEALIHAAGLPILETAAISEQPDRVPVILHIARFIGLLVIPYAFVLALVTVFRHRARALRVRLWRLHRAGHTVVCGLGQRGIELVTDLRSRGERVAVVDRDGGSGLAGTARGLGAVVITGDATQPAPMRDAGAGAARELFIMCGTDEANIAVLRQAAALSPRPSRPAPPGRGTARCSVEVSDARIREFMHRTIAPRAGFDVDSFDTHEATARRVLSEWPLDRNGRDAHLVIVGWSAMARALLQQGLLLGQIPGRFRVTVLSTDPQASRERFLMTYPCFRDNAYGDPAGMERLTQAMLPTCDFAALPESDAELLGAAGPLLPTVSSDVATSFHVCLDDGLHSAAFVSAVLPSLATAVHERGGDAVVCYHTDRARDEHWFAVQQSLRQLAPGVDVHAYGHFLDGCSVQSIHGHPTDDLARGLAEVYRRTFGGAGWSVLGVADRTSNRHAADHIPVKLRSIGATLVQGATDDDALRFTPSEIASLVELEHRRWCVDRLLDGWRPLLRSALNVERWAHDRESYKSRKLHIDLVPFDVLDDATRAKDRAQIEAIPDVARAAGYRVERTAAVGVVLAATDLSVTS